MTSKTAVPAAAPIVTDPAVAAAYSLLGRFRAVAVANKKQNGMPLTDAEKAEFPDLARGYVHNAKYDA